MVAEVVVVGLGLRFGFLVLGLPLFGIHKRGECGAGTRGPAVTCGGGGNGPCD